MMGILLMLIKDLSIKYNFNYIEGLDFVGILNKKIIIPYDGSVMKNRCRAIKWAYGLHVQCRNYPEENERYCFKCYNKKHNICGDINERLRVGILDFMDKKKRPTITWMNYIKKKGLDENFCLKYLKELGINIPKEHLILNVRPRGRPKNIKKNKIIVNNIFDIIKSSLCKEPIAVHLYKIDDSDLGIDEEGNLYEFMDGGAVRIFR